MGCPRTEQAIATTGRRLQHFTITTERLANRGYVNLKGIFFDDRARPYASREVVLGDKLTCRLNQNLHDVERAPPDRDRHSARSQFAPSEIDLPLAQRMHQLSALRAHSCLRISHVSSAAYNRAYPVGPTKADQTNLVLEE